jgi:hypothetical protein
MEMSGQSIILPLWYFKFYFAQIIYTRLVKNIEGPA